MLALIMCLVLLGLVLAWFVGVVHWTHKNRASLADLQRAVREAQRR